MAAPVSNYRGVAPEGDTPKNVADVINKTLLNGKFNNVTEVTLTANAATTTFAHPLIGGFSLIVFTPLSANAKAEGTPWVSARDARTCTLNHANNAQTDRTYSVGIFG